MSAGYSLTKASKFLFCKSWEGLRNLPAGQIVCLCQLNFWRINADLLRRLVQDVEFNFVNCWIHALLPPRGANMLTDRLIESLDDMVKVMRIREK